MRQIERDTIKAVSKQLYGTDSKHTWKKANMLVQRTVDLNTRETYVTVYLHGNAIARVNAETGALEITLAGWDTVTTRSRINALVWGLAPNSCVRVWRKRGVTQVFQDGGDLDADTDSWYFAGTVNS